MEAPIARSMERLMRVPMAQPMALHWDHQMAIGLEHLIEASKDPSMALHWDRLMATHLARPMEGPMVRHLAHMMVQNWVDQVRLRRT
jgi:hypothetical protein